MKRATKKMQIYKGIDYRTNTRVVRFSRVVLAGTRLKCNQWWNVTLYTNEGDEKKEQISDARRTERRRTIDARAHAHAHTPSTRSARFARTIGRRVRAALITFNYRESNGVSRPATIRPYFKFHWATWRRQFNFAPQSWPRKLSKPIIRSTRGPLACSRATGMKHGN